MNVIKLTKEHKSKLLEMCKVLFPEYKIIEFEKSGMIVLFKQVLTPTKNYDYIHWFEFCMTHLMLKFYWDDYEKSKDFLMRCLFQSEKPHPVDFLYEKFKK